MRKRAFIIGILFSAGIAMIDPFFVFRGLSVRFCWEAWAPAAIFLLFFLVLLSCIHRFFELKTPELLLIFVMSSTASVLPSLGFVSSFIPIVAGFKYFASPVNQWSELIIDRVRPIMMLQDEQAVAYFYEGLPAGAAVPFGAWLKPMGFMLVFILALAFLSICLMVLFRKQWVEKERLIYPLMILPLEMVKKEQGSRIPLLFRDNLFWLGFGVVFLYYFLNWLSVTTTGSMMFNLWGYLSFLRGNIGLGMRTDFPIIGLAYLIPRSISLSLWLFHILYTVQNGVFAMSGFTVPGMHDTYGGRTIISSFQGGGAMIILVIALFWRARKHLAGCIRKAFNPGCGIDDSCELLSYRTAVFGTMISFLALLAFMRYFGLPWFASAAFLFFALVVLIGMSRIVCQVGLPAARPQCIPATYTANLLSPGLVTSQGYLALGLQHSWAAEMRSSVMITTGHTLKIQEEAHISPRLLFAGIITALIVSYTASAWMHIYSAYKVGAINAGTTGLGGFFFGAGLSRNIASFALSKINNPVTPDIIVSRYIVTGIGAAIMGALMFLHSRFLWWPVHYIGFPIGDSTALRVWWFSIFLAWLIKGLVLKFGGHAVYKKSVSFFLGLILSNVVWGVVQSILNLILNQDTRGIIGW